MTVLLALVLIVLVCAGSASLANEADVPTGKRISEDSVFQLVPGAQRIAGGLTEKDVRGMIVSWLDWRGSLSLAAPITSWSGARAEELRCSSRRHHVRGKKDLLVVGDALEEMSGSWREFLR